VAETYDRPYLDAPLQVAQALAVLPVPRTGQPLASAQGKLSYLTYRPAYEADILDRLPCVVVDVTPDRPVRYQYAGTELLRGMPLSIVLFTPLYAYLDGLSADEVKRAVRAADEDVKTILGDLEAVLNSEEARRRIHKRLELTTAIVFYDELAFESRTHVRARVAELQCVLWHPVPGH
jgi:hypothetical protein